MVIDFCNSCFAQKTISDCCLVEGAVNDVYVIRAMLLAVISGQCTVCVAQRFYKIPINLALPEANGFPLAHHHLVAVPQRVWNSA